MLIAEIKVNEKQIAVIQAQRGELVEEGPGDFVGDNRTYRYQVSIDGETGRLARSISFDITHNRRLGWQGLLYKILGEIIPVVVETVSEGDEGQHPTIGHYRVVRNEEANEMGIVPIK